jgi:hypothetical protein
MKSRGSICRLDKSETGIQLGMNLDLWFALKKQMNSSARCLDKVQRLLSATAATSDRILALDIVHTRSRTALPVREHRHVNSGISCKTDHWRAHVSIGTTTTTQETS